MFGKKKKLIDQQAATIGALEAKLQELEQKNASLSEQLGGYEAKERTILRTLTDATAQADRVLEDAKRTAEEIVDRSNADAESARRNAELVVDGAYQNARDIVKDAEAESRRKLDETQMQIENYAAMLSEYDKLVQENIRMAEENARRFAELAEKLHAALPQAPVIFSTQIVEPVPQPEAMPSYAAPEQQSSIPEQHRKA